MMMVAWAMDSELTFAASSSGTYYISVRALCGFLQWQLYGGNRTGCPACASGRWHAGRDGGLSDGWILGGVLRGSGRYFDTTTSNQITVNITGLTAAGQQLARWAFEAWEMVADLVFVETSASDALITFDDYDPRGGAYSTSELNWDGTIQSSEVVVDTTWLDYYGTDISSYSFSTYIHEIGHALGLGHQGNYNGSATYGVDETFANDSWQMSIMSYFDQEDNTTTNASYAALVSTMMVDIVAIQNLYGAPGSSSATAGDTTWGPGTEMDGYMREVLENGGSDADCLHHL